MSIYLSFLPSLTDPIFIDIRSFVISNHCSTAHAQISTQHRKPGPQNDGAVQQVHLSCNVAETSMPTLPVRSLPLVLILVSSSGAEDLTQNLLVQC
jgi:hypothetical protein